MSELDIGSKRIGHVVEGFLGKVQERYDIGGVNLLGISSGFSIVDLWTGGFQPDELIIYAASTSVGKSAALVSTVLQTAEEYPNEAVLLFSLEMRAEVVVNRLLSARSGVPTGRIKRGRMDADELARVRLAAEEFYDSNIYVIDHTATSDQVVRAAYEIGEHTDVKLVAIDYVGLLQDTKGANETERMGQISRNIRAMARPDNLNIPILAAAQLNRAAQSSEDPRPKLHHLKNTSNLEQDSQIVLLFYRPHKIAMERGAAPQEIETDAEIIIAKNREGQLGITKAEFVPRMTEWRQVSKD